jgi:hypothetical protein
VILFPLILVYNNKLAGISESGENMSGRVRWVVSFILIGIAIGSTFLLITYFFSGDTFLDRLEASYRFLWEHTTRREFTDIMRERPWLFIIPGVNIILVNGLLMPLKYWARALLVYIALAIGVIAGHLFW